MSWVLKVHNVYKGAINDFLYLRLYQLYTLPTLKTPKVIHIDQ